MRRYVIYVLTEDKVKVEYQGHDGARRKITFHVEDTVVVQSDNPNKLRHRGRQAVIKSFIGNDFGNVVKAKVQFTDNKRPGRVDLEDIVLKASPEQESKVEQVNLSKTRYLPETAPDSLFTKVELSRMGLVPLHDEVAYVRYPEQRREYKLFSIDETRESKRQKSSLLFKSVDSTEDVLTRRANAIKVRDEQFKLLPARNSIVETMSQAPIKFGLAHFQFTWHLVWP
ncbi:hypothetical protein GK047_26625 [Paenibacillus sp. SYP-B3998]|uniref:Uncharacterized protein n=1 Tax=Paenibacillus sp. SYP-B3998 TaxID=2678564 RepID=A0A6G4A548_9BACL|nr:hypothetical protein [Paenibacillus sp. SYP-B3998]NEW09515.1 hypothetical protein [Paenibacillus sp. SYP-B3998]